MTVKDRWDMAKQNKLCFACLKTLTDKLSCEKKDPCKHCKRRHSTWLHEDRSPKVEEITNAMGVISVAHGIVPSRKQVLLATALVTV